MPSWSLPDAATGAGVSAGVSAGAGVWVLAGPARALRRLAPLIEAHRVHRPVRLASSLADAMPYLDGAAAVLVVGGGAPGRALPGVFVPAPGGRSIPAGWLPAARLAPYARAAAALHLRAAPGPCALLAGRDDRALNLAGTLAAALPERAVLWTAERLSRYGLVRALGMGLGGALYVGHARAGGWLGYGGFGADALRQAASGGQPMGALLSLSCSTASRPRSGRSFAEAAVLAGLCGAALGACRRTLHAENRALAEALVPALANAAATLAGLLEAVPPVWLRHYRIVGDPLSPLAGAIGAMAGARAVFAPAPDADLPVVPLAAWGEAVRGLTRPLRDIS